MDFSSASLSGSTLGSGAACTRQPHSEQNFAVAASIAPHSRHSIIRPLLYHHPQARQREAIKRGMECTPPVLPMSKSQSQLLGNLYPHWLVSRFIVEVPLLDRSSSCSQFVYNSSFDVWTCL